MNQVVWRDFHSKRIIFIVGELVLLAFMSSGIRLNNLLTVDLLFPLFPLILLMITLRFKLTYITLDGIRIGNAVNGEYYSIRLNKSRFVKWSDIKKINFYKKRIEQPLTAEHQNFLLLKTKDGEKLESFIAQPKSFVQTLKTLKKDHLLSKDSKYLDLLKK